MCNMTSNELREKEQKNALVAWKNAGFRGSIIAGTGFGKTKCGIDAACYPVRLNPEHRSIILVPTNALKKQWKKEAELFGYAEEIKLVEIVCFASAYKLKDNQYDTVVVDEIHLCLSDKFYLFFKNNAYNKILGLTATVPEDGKHRMLLGNLARPIFHLPLDKAITLGLVAPYIVYMIPVEFERKDKIRFNSIQKKFLFYRGKLGYEHAFDNAKAILENPKNYPREKVQQAVVFMDVINKRRNMLHNNKAKLKFTKQIVEAFSDQTILIFNGNNEFSDKIADDLESCESWHSGKSDKIREGILGDFVNGDFNVLSTTKAFNQGMSVSNASVGIINGLTSKTITMIQRIGRLLRIHADKKSAYIFVPYVKDSREERWMEKSLRTMENCIHVNSLEEVWKLLKLEPA